jgi:putative toxin-antitoxin system antitoxin component (TIGR02293 family)
MALTKKTGNARAKRTSYLMRKKLQQKQLLTRSSLISSTQHSELPSIIDVIGEAQEFFGNKETAKDWLFSEIALLGNKTPIQLCEEGKAQEVIDFLGGIEHGVYQ